MRKKIIAGNWKMNKNVSDTKEYFEKFNELIKDSDNDIIICTPFIDLAVAKENAANNISIGAQNMHFADKGAYTGEVSGKMLNECGIPYVIIGHSERREYFNETDDMVNKKIKAAFANELTPILCVGETLEEREAGKAKDKVVMQIQKDFLELDAELAEKVIVAYEPIWAIGTGKTCDSDEANRVIAMIRTVVKEVAGVEAADAIRILYGGSVKPSTIAEQMSKSDIDGALIGGASLKADSLNEIIANTMKVVANV